MSVISALGLDRFTPDAYKDKENPPVYLIEPATLRRRGQFFTALTAAGARMPQSSELIGAIRKGVKQLVVEQDQAEANAIVDLLEAKHPLADDDRIKLVIILDGLRQAPFIPFTQIEATQEHWDHLAPLIAADMFLAGWENVKEPFQRKNGMVPDRFLEENISARDISAIGWRAIYLMNVDHDTKKNLFSPPQSVVSH
jgi:hypothetical protein